MELQTTTPPAPNTALFYRRPQNHAETFWTDEKDAELKALYATGMSFTQIGEVIGTRTRNMVCGRVRKLKLTRDTGYENIVPTRPRRAAGSTVKAVRTGKTSFKVLDFRRPWPDGFVGALIDDYVPRVAPDVPVEQRKTLVELGNEHCRWPFNDPAEHGFYFCGDPSADLFGGRAYCDCHAQLSRPLPNARRP